LTITIKYPQTENGLAFNSRLWVLLSMPVRHPYHHWSYFFCLLYFTWPMHVWKPK